MPVHSMAMSTPSSRCGSSAGFLIAVTRMRRPSTTRLSPSTPTSLGKRPCTESKRSRWALVSTGPRSLTATTSMSRRPLSTMARRMLRPMRPKPLMATFTVMSLTPSRPVAHPGPNGGVVSQIVGSEHPVGHRLRRNSEVTVKILVGRAGPKPLHADEDAVVADDRVPAPAHGGLDGHLHGRVADHFPAHVLGLAQEQVERRHRHDARRHAPLDEEFLRAERNLDLRARREQGCLGLAVRGRRELVGAGGAQVAVAG